MREFLLLPALVAAAYLGLGILSVALDKNSPDWIAPVQHELARVISRPAATGLLAAIATSVVTVTSITFSVLLLAVQQTASAMTPAVFDQFLRRRSNQFYLGSFVGLSLYSFLVLASIGPKAAPALGAAFALLLTVVAFGVLVVLIYSTVDEMRPTNVTQVIHDRALEARVAEGALLRRTRRHPTGHGPVTVTVRTEQDGYVTEIDIDAIADALPETPGAEVVLSINLGTHVAFGQPIATVMDDDEARSQRTAEAVRRAVSLDRSRDLSVDASYAVEQLGNIAWTALSTAKQNPQTGRDAIDRLRDLGARWSRKDPHVLSDETALAIVYRDRDLDLLLDTLLGALVVTSESKQVGSAAHVIQALADVLGTVPQQSLDAFLPAFERTLAVAWIHPLTRSLEDGLNHIAATLSTRGCDEQAQRVCELVAAGSKLDHTGRPPRS